MAGRPNTAIEMGLLVLLSTLWGASYSFIHVGVETIPPVTFIAARTLLAGGLLLLALRLRGGRLPRDGATWRRFFLQALLNSVVPFTLIAWGEQTTPESLAAILNATTPIFAFLLTALVTRHERVTPLKLFGVSIGLFGICLIIGVDALHGVGQNVGGQLAIAAASLFFGAAAITGKMFRGMDPLVPAAGSLLSGAALLVPASLVIDHPWTLAPSAASLLALLGLSVFSTALALAIYFRLMQTLGSVGATAQSYLRVPIGVGVGVLFMGEHLNATAWLGLACVIPGVMAMTWPERTGSETATPRQQA